MRVYNIPPTESFVDALAKGIVDRYGTDPLELTKIRILLPNRRACRNLREAFLRMTQGKPILLPSIRPVGDVDEEELFFESNSENADIPPAMPPLRRILILARYLMAYDKRYTYAQALSLAGDLGRFLDTVETEGLDLQRLDDIVPETYAAHWQLSLTFLKDVLRQFWPKQLEAEGSIDSGARRRLYVENLTAKLANDPPTYPVIAAGSTGSIPATAALLKAVAGLPDGSVVLPGLDTVLEDDHWSEGLEDGHPQAGLANLLLNFGITRNDVKSWIPEKTGTAREIFISALMRPPSAIHEWAKTPLPENCWEGIGLIEAENLDEEAASIALLMRAHVEDKSDPAPCVLVTADRLLANRVTLILNRWDIAIDDSAGVPLHNTQIGKWLLLLCDTLSSGLDPVMLLALLKNGLAGGDQNFRNAVRNLDKFALRGPKPEEGFSGLKHRTKKHPDLSALITDLETRMTAPQNLQGLITIAENLATTTNMHGSQRLWSGEAGEAMSALLSELLAESGLMPSQDWVSLRAILETAMSGISVRPRYGTYPRLAILGPMEARLYKSTKMILGGLNEGSWPKPPDTDGWMSREMRKNFGLPSLEKSITLSAHDFAQGLGAEQVILTRSKNRDGSPTTKSRWLQRLDALAKAQPYKVDITSNVSQWLRLARTMDQPAAVTPVNRPSPCPPLSARPKKFSVTEISKWQRDPYYVYAKHILELRPLEPLSAEPDAADQGNLIHEALKIFGETYPEKLPENAAEQLIEIGRKIFLNAHEHPDVIGHWWPRFEQLAHALTAHEDQWRQEMVRLYPEISGKMDIAGITLEGRADRFEKRREGWAVIDYKSGVAPAITKIKSGEEPQLTLLGMMLLNGCFDEHLGDTQQEKTLETLAYWKTGSARNGLVVTQLRDEPDQYCAEARQGLESLIHAYSNDTMPYASWPDPSRPLRDDYEYAHLARIAEWANADDLDTSGDDT